MESLGELNYAQLMEKALKAEILINQRRKASSKYREANHERENERSKMCMRAKYQRDKEAKIAAAKQEPLTKPAPAEKSPDEILELVL